MERLVLNKLLEWKNSEFRKPLLLKGVRQVGKTWILKEFGKRYYKNTAYFNFDESPEYKQFFETTKDVKRILDNLIMASGQDIEKNNTLIIFDEIQDCPNVINSLKYCSFSFNLIRSKLFSVKNFLIIFLQTISLSSSMSKKLYSDGSISSNDFE